MKQYQSVLFDLDGTISRSAPGIIRSLRYGLAGVGIDEPEDAALTRFIGPPLNVELRAAYGLSPEAIERVISRFRDRYESEGIFECELYPGIAELIRSCSAAGCRLAVASSKPEPHVRRLMAHFGLAPCFAVISGSRIEDELDNRTGADNKDRVIAKTLALLGEGARPALMVGDTKYDILGAHHNGLDAAAVTYGYGTRADLAAAGPDFTADSPADLARLLLPQA